MTDRILLTNIRVDGRHGVSAEERAAPQPFEVDVELVRDLRAAGRTDDLRETVDYSVIDALVRDVVATRSFRLLESIAETIAAGILAGFAVDEVVVRVRKPAVRLAGPIDFSGVEIRRTRRNAG
jgi:7,8-dihydroneopterin aldolase/epimerase/oxygenase